MGKASDGHSVNGGRAAPGPRLARHPPELNASEACRTAATAGVQECIDRLRMELGNCTTIGGEGRVPSCLAEAMARARACYARGDEVLRGWDPEPPGGR